MAYEPKKSNNGNFMFNLKAGNNQVILTSEMYGEKDENFEVKNSASGKAHFVLRVSNKEGGGRLADRATADGGCPVPPYRGYRGHRTGVQGFGMCDRKARPFF